MATVIRGDDNFDTGVNGKLLQARTFSIAGNSSSTAQATWFDTGVSITVTPVSTNSILLVHCSTIVGMEAGSTHQRNASGSGVFVNSDLNAKTFKAQAQKAAGSSSEAGNIWGRWYTESKHTITVLEIDAS